MMTPRKIEPTINVSKYLIITLLTGYKNKMFYYFSIYKIRFVTIFEKKKQEFCSKSIPQHIWGQIFKDKYHKKKKWETKKMFVYLSAYTAYFKTKI